VKHTTITTEKRVGYYGCYFVIVPDHAAGRRKRFTVYRIPATPSARVRIVGRELTFGFAKKYVHRLMNKKMKFFTKRIDTAATIEIFNSAQPFPYVVIDNLLDSEALRGLIPKYPSVEEKKWWQYDNPLERKFAFNDLSQLDVDFREFFDEANSSDVVGQLGRLTGLENLVPDHTLNGGGLHQIKPGGKLDVHEDYNIHRPMKAFRKVNMIVYVNENWDDSYGGELQLWNADMTCCMKKVSPVFNRVVIFRTDMKSNHGHPDPLACPEGMTRKSLALYFYVPMSPEEWDRHEYKSTQFKKRPEDPDSVEINELRMKRNKGRVADKIT